MIVTTEKAAAAGEEDWSDLFMGQHMHTYKTETAQNLVLRTLPD